MKFRNQKSGIRNQESGTRNQGLKLIFVYCLLFTVYFFSSCHHDRQQQLVSEDSLKEHLINANKIIVKDESKEIDEFIERHQWKMNSTGTGLRYSIYKHGDGKAAGEKKQVTFTCSVYLLDGTLCYTYDAKKPVTIVLGIGAQTRGLEEGIMLMHEGDQARFVVPFHLAYGFQGDGDKVPGQSPLFYDVTLLSVSKIAD
jgi:FKBP-type peptidyl-prolyl cis-trans isomerase